MNDAKTKGQVHYNQSQEVSMYNHCLIRGGKMTSRKEIENILKDYHWMINSIKIMQEHLDDSIGEGLVAQGGIESTLPKPQGVTGDPVYREYIRREKHWKRIEEYTKKVKVIQERIHVITDEREIEVLHWLLEGNGYSWISRHMGLSVTHTRRLRDSIVNKMANTVDTVKTANTV